MPLKILFVSGRELDYSRNFVILNSLKKLGSVTVVDLPGINNILVRSILLSALGILRLLVQRYDLVFVGFYGHILMLVFGLLNKTPILFDVFLSTYDTLVNDRKSARKNSITAHLAFFLDQYSCSKATRIIIDTENHKRYFMETFGVPDKKMDILFVGCDERLFFPREEVEKPIINVLFYGSFLPLHGIDVIVQAARLLSQNETIKIEIIGPYKKYPIFPALAKKLNLRNLEFHNPVPLAVLPGLISRSSICLGGHFGGGEKAKRVIPGKVFQFMAMAKPIIVGDNQANAELLTHKHDAWFCKMNDPVELAGAISFLAADPILRNKLGENAYQTFKKFASSEVIDKKIYQIVKKTL